jgi:hypothetical protein
MLVVGGVGRHRGELFCIDVVVVVDERPSAELAVERSQHNHVIC